MKMNKLMCITAIFSAVCVLSGCSSKVEDITNTIVDADLSSIEAGITSQMTEAIDELYATQLNYSNGVAQLNIIPDVTVKVIYDNWDTIADAKLDKAPIMLREYVDPSIVYFDYDTDYSIIWNKDTGDITIDKTDTDAREDYKQKQHK